MRGSQDWWVKHQCPHLDPGLWAPFSPDTLPCIYPEAGRVPPCGPCRSPRRAASPGSAPAPSPASPHGSPSPSGNRAHHDRHGQTGRQPPAGYSGRQAKTGEPSLGHPSGEGREGQVSEAQRFQDISVAEGLHVQATAWGPRSLSLRNSHPLSRSQDNRLSGSVTLSGKETEAFAGSSHRCIPEPLGHSCRGVPATPSPRHTQTHRQAFLLTSCLTFCSSTTS